MPTTQPQLDLEFVADPFCFLSGERDFNIWIKFRLHHKEAITVVSTGSLFDPTAFSHKRIEIIDNETGYKVDFPTHQTSESQESTLTLEPERGSYFFWSTSPETKWHKFPFDISGLAPNRKYTVKYRNHGVTEWSPARQPSQPDKEVQDEPIVVNLLGGMAPTFTTRSSLPPRPPVTSNLSIPTPVCALSGAPSLTVSIDWKLDGNRPIWALIAQPKGHNIGIEIRDPERKNRRIGPPPDLVGTDDEKESDPLPDEEILRIEGETTFRQSYTLCTEKKGNGLLNSDTWNLVSGKTYQLTLRKSRWRWRYEDQFEPTELQDMATLRALLREEPWVEWKPDCNAEILAE